MTKKPTRKIVPHKQGSGMGFGRGRTLQEFASWPLYQCLITKEWDDPMVLTQLMVARRSTRGDIAVAGFVVDKACLGVKNAMVLRPLTVEEYLQHRSQIMSTQTMVAGTVDLVVKIVQESIAYAAQFGFRPNKDTADALLVVGPASPENITIPLRFGGPNGKPYFIRGPYDNAEQIMRKLDRAVGPGGYDYLVDIGGWE